MFLVIASLPPGYGDGAQRPGAERTDDHSLFLAIGEFLIADVKRIDSEGTAHTLRGILAEKSKSCTQFIDFNDKIIQ